MLYICLGNKEIGGKRLLNSERLSQVSAFFMRSLSVGFSMRSVSQVSGFFMRSLPLRQSATSCGASRTRMYMLREQGNWRQAAS